MRVAIVAPLVAHNRRQTQGSTIMKETAQRIFARMSLVARYLVLRRQLAEVVRVIETLNTPDRRLLHAHACRELDISARESRDAGTTNAAFARARSDNSRLRVLGIGQWLASAMRETEESAHGEFQDLHRQLMRAFRLLRESVPASAMA